MLHCIVRVVQVGGVLAPLPIGSLQIGSQVGEVAVFYNTFTECNLLWNVNTSVVLHTAHSRDPFPGGFHIFSAYLNL